MEPLSPFWIAIPPVISFLCAYAMGIFSKNQFPVDGKTILITGGSEGMGLSVAKQLAAKGANIAIVARRKDKLEEALVQIKAAARNPDRQRFHYVVADVAIPDYSKTVLANVRVWNNNSSPDIVWCIAGVSTPGLWIEQDLADTKRQMDINFYGQAEMAHSILREWTSSENPADCNPASDAKHVILTASVVAFCSIVGYGSYAPSKFAIRGLADALAQELMLYPQNIKVHVVYPGTILSPGLERENEVKPEVTHLLEASDPKQTPDQVAAKSIQGLEHGDFFVTVAFLGSLMRWGMLGGSLRNSWLIDTIMAMLVPIIWIFVQADLTGTVKKYAKKHGHPRYWETKTGPKN
ncbi:3-ketodihydrosphingosine reductase gsl-3 [Ceratocystis fimbriata CBS 114723]|uniref:3-dehydrosphinganine reductase n=2 Tax=Ceratocystis TaxID=5157 RepID=A0A0F8AY10_CERFI|nr:3-ketodihydrosphingosine reductase tsc-10 [Ceratocystis platani]PHH53544.1 3-ketodihydrosphingosine reductase gsl-3 [Ceratocystis fimbriata CBS 114723]